MGSVCLGGESAREGLAEPKLNKKRVWGGCFKNEAEHP